MGRLVRRFAVVEKLVANVVADAALGETLVDFRWGHGSANERCLGIMGLTSKTAGWPWIDNVRQAGTSLFLHFCKVSIQIWFK